MLKYILLNIYFYFAFLRLDYVYLYIRQAQNNSNEQVATEWFNTLNFEKEK